MGSAKSAFVTFTLLCVSGSAVSAELERPPEESSSRGLHGHTIIRTYGAIVPAAAPEQTLEHAGWGTGLSVSYGVTRAVQLSLGLAYYQFEAVVHPDIDCDCSISSRNAVRQTTMSVDVQSPVRSWLRPWLGVGFGFYEVTQTWNVHNDYSQYVDTGTRLGLSWGLGVTALLDQRLAIDVGGRYHHGLGRPFLESPGYSQELRLFSIQTGLSYVLH